jgi:hypothetical protein
VQIGSRTKNKPSRGRGSTEPFDVTSLNADIVLPENRSTSRPKPRPTTTRELADEIDGLAASLTQIDPRSTERLRDLAGSLSTEEGRLRWADVDLRQAFHSEYLAHFYAVRREGGFAPKTVEIADNIRNSLVLAPVFLTWLGLWEATTAYGEYLDRTRRGRQSFLYLWQKGFGGEGGCWPLSSRRSALIDALVILFIFGLTIYSHGRRERQERRSPGPPRSSRQTSTTSWPRRPWPLPRTGPAGRRCSPAASSARRALRAQQPGAAGPAAGRARPAGGDLRPPRARVRRLRRLRQRDAGRRRGDAPPPDRAAQVSTGLHQALDDMTAEVGVSGDQQKSLLTAVTSLERLVATGIQSDHGVTRKIAEAAQVLTEAAERSLAGAEAAAQAGRVASEAVRGIAEISSSLVTGHNRVEHAIAARARPTPAWPTRSAPG